MSQDIKIAFERQLTDAGIEEPIRSQAVSILMAELSDPARQRSPQEQGIMSQVNGIIHTKQWMVFLRKNGSKIEIRIESQADFCDYKEGEFAAFGVKGKDKIEASWEACKFYYSDIAIGLTNLWQLYVNERSSHLLDYKQQMEEWQWNNPATEDILHAIKLAKDDFGIHLQVNPDEIWLPKKQSPESTN
jgi:hypothetical protein